MKILKPGQIVTIYQDPVTEKKPEGKARLVFLDINDTEQEYWKVEFISDGFKCGRWIKKEK